MIVQLVNSVNNLQSSLDVQKVFSRKLTTLNIFDFVKGNLNIISAYKINGNDGNIYIINIIISFYKQILKMICRHLNIIIYTPKNLNV